MDGVLGYVDIESVGAKTKLGVINIESQLDKEDYYSIKTYRVLESQVAFKGEQLIKLLILEDIETGSRQLFQFDNISNIWGVIKTSVVGDKIQLCWLIEVKNISNSITYAKILD